MAPKRPTHWRVFAVLRQLEADSSLGQQVVVPRGHSVQAVEPTTIMRGFTGAVHMWRCE